MRPSPTHAQWNPLFIAPFIFLPILYIFPTSSLAFQVNHLHLNPYSRVYFGSSQGQLIPIVVYSYYFSVCSKSN